MNALEKCLVRWSKHFHIISSVNYKMADVFLNWLKDKSVPLHTPEAFVGEEV
jgi:hypothetical protein